MDWVCSFWSGQKCMNVSGPHLLERKVGLVFPAFTCDERDRPISISSFSLARRCESKVSATFEHSHLYDSRVDKKLSGVNYYYYFEKSHQEWCIGPNHRRQVSCLQHRDKIMNSTIDIQMKNLREIVHHSIHSTLCKTISAIPRRPGVQGQCHGQETPNECGWIVFAWVKVSGRSNHSLQRIITIIWSMQCMEIQRTGRHRGKRYSKGNKIGNGEWEGH